VVRLSLQRLGAEQKEGANTAHGALGASENSSLLFATVSYRQASNISGESLSTSKERIFSIPSFAREAGFSRKQWGDKAP